MAITNPNLMDGFDQNNTNSAEPVAGLQNDGYADNEIPLAANHNFMFKDLYRYMQFLKDTGVSQWDNATSYEQYARTMRDGIIYQSLSDANQGNDPLTNLDTFWSYEVSRISGSKNLIIDGKKQVNPDNYAGGVLADGVYGYAMWKGANSDADIEQVIEQANISTGTYTISWVGGGTATVDGNSGLSSGDSVSLTVSGNVSVIVPKASTNIQLESGSVKTEFEHEDIQVETAKSQRYYEKRVQNFAVNYAGAAGQNTAGVHTYQVKKRVLPTVTLSNFVYSNASNAQVNRQEQNGFTILINWAGAGRASVEFTMTADARL